MVKLVYLVLLDMIDGTQRLEACFINRKDAEGRAAIRQLDEWVTSVLIVPMLLYE